MPALTAKKIVIVGAGAGGIAAAIALKTQLNVQNFTVYEKGADVGGTWRENTYPGCACDVQSHWYSLSTDLNPSWTKAYSDQPEILQYFRDTARRRGLLEHITFRAKLISAVWDDAQKHYKLQIDHLAPTTNDVLRSEQVIADILISATGGLHIPAFPSVPGFETFKGKVWHAAEWRHDVDLKGQRIGIIGNGCSGAQIVPVISNEPSTQVVNFCRTPSWFFPRINPNFTKFWKWILAYVPFALRIYRFSIYALADSRYFIWNKTSTYFRAKVEKQLRRYIRSAAPKHLLDKLIPSYDFGCKRVISDPGYLKSLHRPNVLTEWDPIDSVVENGIKLKTGKIHELDIIVPATGFTVGSMSAPVKGIECTVGEYYEKHGGPTAYRGTTIPGFPNFFLILGDLLYPIAPLGSPNIASGHASAIFVEEVQVNYIMKLIKPIIQGKIDALDIKSDASDNYNNELQARIKHTVWDNCLSYYNQQGGKNVAMYPGTVLSFWWSLWRPIWKHYNVWLKPSKAKAD